MAHSDLREAPPIERTVGMAYYLSDADGVGGRLRDRPADFRVEELEAVDAEPLGADPAAYPHLVLRVTLERWDTNDFAQALSNQLGISRERVSWAGTKDKHAVTTQLFSVEGVAPAALPDLGDATIEPVGRTGRPVLFGDLVGNRFTITVREPNAPERAATITDQLRERAAVADTGRGADEGTGTTVGLPNYFGQQRFGSIRPVTHEVGLAIVRRDWAGAVLAYVGNPHEAEPEATREARAYVSETRDWQGALDRLPPHLGYERAMCQTLVERGDTAPADFRAAIASLPSNLQTLFVNAVQSYLFNRMVSARLDRGLGLSTPVEGDVVCFADRDASDDLVIPDPDRTQRVTADRLTAIRRHCERGRAFVTAPLVGTETELGAGDPGDIERSVLEDADVDPADFDLPGEFHSTGTRRAISLVTDLAVERDPLTFAFALPKGAYATVVLREYLKDPQALG